MVTPIVIEITSLSAHRSVPTVELSRPLHDASGEPVNKPRTVDSVERVPDELERRHEPRAASNW